MQFNDVIWKMIHDVEKEINNKHNHQIKSKKNNFFHKHSLFRRKRLPELFI